MGKAIGIIIILLLLIIIIGAVVAVTKVKSVSQQLFGSADVIKEVKDLAERNAYTEANTPKSVRAMTSVFLPQIVRDFPEFNLEEMKSKAEDVLFQYLRALDSDNYSVLEDVTEELQERIKNEIAMNVDQYLDSQYSSPKIHRTEIANYVKKDGKCIVTFQSAVEYFFTQKKDGKIVAGTDLRKTQARYDIECIYIQDREVVESSLEAGLGLTCPNCGAPIVGTGKKACSYCGTEVQELNIKVWHFSNIRKA